MMDDQIPEYTLYTGTMDPNKMAEHDISKLITREFFRDIMVLPFPILRETFGMFINGTINYLHFVCMYIVNQFAEPS